MLLKVLLVMLCWLALSIPCGLFLGRVMSMGRD
jgi:hypothetical protein